MINYYDYNRFTAVWIFSGTTEVSQYQKKTFTHSPIVVIIHALSASSVYYDPWHPPCSIYVPDSLFPQSLFKFSLVCLLVWHPPLHFFTQYLPSFCSTCPYHRNLFCCITKVMLSNSSFSQPFTRNSIL